jgi:hypothetical protein
LPQTPALPHLDCYPFLWLPQQKCYRQGLRIEERFCNEERLYRPRLDEHVRCGERWAGNVVDEASGNKIR